MLTGDGLYHAADIPHGMAPLYLRTHPLLRVSCARRPWGFDHAPLDLRVQLFPFAVKEEHASVLDRLTKGGAFWNGAEHHRRQQV